MHQSFFPKAASHLHHEIPQAAGGKDTFKGESNLVYLCSNCHNCLHRIEEKLRAGKVGVANDIAEAYCPNQIPMKQRLLELANYARQFMEEQNRLPQDPNERIDLSFSMYAKDFGRLKLLLKEVKKPDGKQASQQWFLETAVLNAMRVRR